MYLELIVMFTGPVAVWHLSVIMVDLVLVGYPAGKPYDLGLGVAVVEW